MFYEKDIYISKRERPCSPQRGLDLFEMKFPPVNEKQLKSVILKYLMKEDLVLPISSKEIIEKIKSNFSDKKNILIKINKINYEEIFEELGKINTFSSEKISFGLNCYDVILKINKQKIIQLYREFSSDLPTEMPEFEFKNIKENIFFPNEINNKTKLTQLMSEPTAFKKEKLRELELIQRKKQNIEIREKFISDGNNIKICEFGTREKCFNGNDKNCEKIHYKKIILPQTDESLGNCSYLNTCRQIQFCKYLHYEIDKIDKENIIIEKVKEKKNELPMQWINCDLRQFDFGILGKFNVIMLDPPWDIHMNLPYGTLKDKEMKYMQVGKLIDEGVCFLWVTGRAMELGRECLQNWGFIKVEEIVWIKTNQLQSIIRTGRTGHWLNHSKEHCLVGVKGNPKINRNVDCDVIVSKVRETSRKPDEIYDLIERFHPEGRKIELFARPHNRRPGWLSLGNQLPGKYIYEEEIINNFEEITGKKIDINEMEKNKKAGLEDKDTFNKSVYFGHLKN